MATTNKPVLGVMSCQDCGEMATVHMAGGRRRSLYQRCGCGCIQGNGRFVQSRLWYETEWNDGDRPESSPSGVYNLSDYAIELGKRNDRAKVTSVCGPEKTGSEVEIEVGQLTDFKPADDAVLECPADGSEESLYDPIGDLDGSDCGGEAKPRKVSASGVALVGFLFLGVVAALAGG